MNFPKTSSWFVLISVLMAACGGGGGGSPAPTPQPQSISFASAGPMSGTIGTTLSNTASGGQGSGAITYASSNTAVASVNAATGLVSLVGAGSATITATKAADPNFQQAQASYTVNVLLVQAITFTSTGPLSGAAGTTLNNAATGGAGTGAITYSSSNTAVATVDATTGVVSLVAVGSATVTATKAADATYAQAQANYSINVTIGSQTIAFALTGPIDGSLGAVINNVASGGAGSGVVTYTSSNTNVVTVNSAGAATVVGVGAATITATKAADANYLQAQAAYSVYSQSPDRMTAFIGATGADATLPASASGKQFVRARIADCASLTTVAACTNSVSSAIGASPIADTRATLSTPAYYAVANGPEGTPVEVSLDRFSSRIGHAAVYFKNRYWVIGGGEPILPDNNAPPYQYSAKADVWSSPDGRTWKRETANGGFGTRWFHQAIVYNNRIWILSGAAIPAQSPLPWYADAWSSADGVTWQQESLDLQLPWWSTTINAFIAGGELRVVSGGRIYSYSDSLHQFVKKTSAGVDLTGSVGGRSGASLTFYNNQWWYIGGRTETPINTPIVGNTMNDVWTSADGITWAQKPNAPFSTRYRHSAFVANGKLWVFGGIASTNGVDGAQSADAWSTTDGVTWTQEQTTALARTYLAQTIQEPQRATLIGGVQLIFSALAWQTNDGTTWSELSSRARFSPRLASHAVEFNGQMWVLGGFSVDGRLADRNNNDVWRSSDGVNWNRVTTSGPIFSPRNSHGVLVFNNRLWVIGGQNGPSGNGVAVRLNDVWSSADGATWKLETNAAAFSPRVALGGSVVFNNKMWVISGCTSSTVCSNDVWSSTDGVTWTNVSASAAFSARSGNAVVFNNALWIFGGETGTEAVIDDAWTSADGVTWTPVALGAHFAARNRYGLRVFNGNLYVIGGGSHATYQRSTWYNDVWSTADGANWAQVTNHAAFAPRSLHGLIVHGNELWVLGGFGADWYNDVWRSSDGVNWRIGFSHDIVVP